MSAKQVANQAASGNLQSAADAEGRSLSEMAEHWLDLAAQRQADITGRLGGNALLEAMLTVAEFSRTLVERLRQTGEDVPDIDPTMDLGIREALVAGAAELFATEYPARAHGTTAPDSALQGAVLMKAAGQLLYAILRSDPDNDFRIYPSPSEHLNG